MNKKHFSLILTLLLTIILNMSACLITAFAEEDYLKIYDSTVDFRHFHFETDQNNLLVNYNENEIITTTFRTKVIENAYLKVTLLAEYGGRILSSIYKPTGHEMLYQNPIGTPYGIKEGNFYYDWLMVYGGIFPTFPEPEHGKAWCLPWEETIIEESEDKISVEMRFTDNIDPVDGIPGKFKIGRTDITCVSTVTVYKDKSYVDYNIKLINNRNEEVKYEYWTCITFAPGSEEGNTYCPPDTEMVVPIKQAVLKDDWWAWMGTAEKPVNKSKHVFEYKNLAWFKNWQDMGIAYAYPGVLESWWGVINHENQIGLLRIADNKTHTPGLKFWTWGIDSLETNRETFGDSSRGYIELWAGHSPEFFTATSLAPNEEKEWTEYYIPTAGLSSVTYANRNAAVFMDYSYDENKNEYYIRSDIFTTHPNKNLNVQFNLRGTDTQKVHIDTFVSNPETANKFEFSLPRADVGKDVYALEMVLTDSANNTLLQTEIPFKPETEEEVVETVDVKPISKDRSYLVPVLVAATVVVLAGVFVLMKALKNRGR